MNRTQKRRWNELELKRATLLLEVAQIAAQQARLTTQGAPDTGMVAGSHELGSLAARKQADAEENKAKIMAYIGTIKPGQCGHVSKAAAYAGTSGRTVKNHLKKIAGITVEKGMILVSKTNSYEV